MSGVSLVALRVYEIRDKSAKFGTRGRQMVTLISVMTRRRQWYSYSTIFCIECLRNNGYNCRISYEAVTSKSALTTGTYLPHTQVSRLLALTGISGCVWYVGVLFHHNVRAIR